MAHKGKARSDVDYSPDDPPEAYTNSSIHTRLTEYTNMAKEVYGPDYDPSIHNFDPEIVMRAGGGKAHGRYWMGNSVIDPTTTPTLSQIRARSTSSSPAIRPRQNTSHAQVVQLEVILAAFVCSLLFYLLLFPLKHQCQILQAQVEDEMRRRQEMEQRVQALELEREAKKRAEYERTRAEYERMQQMYRWMQSVGAKTGEAPPQDLFPSQPPPATYPPFGTHPFGTPPFGTPVSMN